MTGHGLIRKKERQPLIRMVKRGPISAGKTAMIRAIAVLCALITGGLIILCLGHNPFAVYAEMLRGALGSKIAFITTVRNTIPLLITAIAVSMAFRMRFWNIGGEGQFLVGATAASYFALFQMDMPKPVLLVTMAVAAIAAGALFALLPAFFKRKWDTNETLFTLMLNYIALEFIKYLQNGPWKDPAMRGFPQIAMFKAVAKLPKVFGVQIGWIIALVIVVLAWIYLNKTKQGYEMAVVGESPNTARYAGMDVGKIMLRTMMISGALCGLAGFLQVSGTDYTLTEATAGGVGFTAISVAWMAKLNPFAMIAVAFVFSVLDKGADKIQSVFKIPASAAEVLTGVMLFFLLGCEFFINYRLIIGRAKEEVKE